jgi:membrane protein
VAKPDGSNDHEGATVLTTAIAVFKEFNKDDLQGLAAEVAYHLLFAVIPLLIFLTALSAFISQAVGIDDIMTSVNEWIVANLPSASQDTVRPAIENVLSQRSSGILSIGGLLALWGARNAMASLMKALNVTFDVAEGRAWWKKQLIAMGLTVALGLGIIGSGTALLLGSGLGDTFAEWVNLGDTWTAVWSWLRWPLVLILVSIMLAFLYSAAPNVHVPFQWLTAGSVLTVVLWAVASFGLSFYFQNFARYTESYGVLGGVLAFVFWLYVMSLILLLGGEVNAVLAKEDGPAIVATAEGEGAAGAESTRQRTSGKDDDGEGGPRPERHSVPARSALEPFQHRQPLASEAVAVRERVAGEDERGRAQRFQTAITALGGALISVLGGLVFGLFRRR